MSVQTPPIGTKPKDKPIMTQRIFIPAPVIDDTAAGKAPRYARLITEYCGWDEKYAQAAEELTRQLADMHPRLFIDNADKVANSYIKQFRISRSQVAHQSFSMRRALAGRKDRKQYLPLAAAELALLAVNKDGAVRSLEEIEELASQSALVREILTRDQAAIGRILGADSFTRVVDYAQKALNTRG